MSNPSPVLRILVVGLDEELIQWFRSSLKDAGLPWRVRVTEPLRMMAPDVALREHDLVVLLWNRQDPATVTTALERVSPSLRAPEGILKELECVGGDQLLQRSVALGRYFEREDVVLLAESGVTLVLSLPKKTSKWAEEAPSMLQRVARHHREVLAMQDSAESRAISQFNALLKSWQRLSDEARMRASEELLKAIGDSARYSDLMAQKALKEQDFATAERWLHRSIDKNPNYLQAFRTLAKLYMTTRRHQEAIPILEKLQMSSPRNIEHLERMGECYIAMEQFSKAEKVLERALAIDEYHVEVRENLGKVKCVLGDHETARRLLATSQHNHELACFFNNLGIQYVESEKFEEAISHYKKAQYALPTNSLGHMLFFNIALAYFKWGMFQQALGYARLALARNPTYDKALKLVKALEKRVGPTPASTLPKAG